MPFYLKNTKCKERGVTLTGILSFYCQDIEHGGMGLFNRIKDESGEDMTRTLPDTNEDITIHGCAVYFDVMRLCQCN